MTRPAPRYIFYHILSMPYKDMILIIIVTIRSNDSIYSTLDTINSDFLITDF